MKKQQKMKNWNTLGRLLLFFCVWTCSLSAFAQESGKLTGKVVDKDGETLPGVIIQYTNGTRGVVTDIDGYFEMDKVPIGTKLIVTFMGLQEKHIVFDGKGDLVLVMEEKANELDEVTVVAFGKQKKNSMVASITTIKPADLKVPSSNLTTAFAGRIPGMIAYQRSGEPGLDDAEFFIRGVTTFGYKKNPLILIDNNESTTTELSRMQPDDVESFSILKDAAAAALYGSRGANGVIMVTTKTGKEGKAKINIRYEEAFSSPTKLPEFADNITYMRLHNEAVRTRNPLVAGPYTQSKIDHTIAGDNPLMYPSNDWYDMLFKPFSNNHRLNFSISGGGKMAAYFVSGSVIQDNGLLEVPKVSNFNNNVNLTRYTLRSNTTINLTPTTEVVVRMSGALDDYNGPVGGGSEIFRNVIRANPVMFPAYYEPDENHKDVSHILFGNARNGNIQAGYINPYAEMVKGYQEYHTSQLNVQMDVKQNLDVLAEGLFLRAMFNSSHYAHFKTNRSYKPYYYEIGGYNSTTGNYMLSPLNEKTGEEWLNFEEGEKTITAANYFESALNYAHDFGEKHEVGGLLVATMRHEAKTQKEGGTDIQLSLPHRNIGFAGRATYAYDSRYLAEVNFGYNGSERFAKKERFGFFPSAGLGYVISNEAFYGEGLKKIVNKLKLRTTYGLVGNDAIGEETDRFFYLSNIKLDDSDRAAAFGTLADQRLAGMSISRYANDLITWEKASKVNLALEAGFLGIFDFEAEVYKEKRTNILMTRANIPTTTGFQSLGSIRANVGEAGSKGIDLSLNLNHSFNKDAWITGMSNFTYATSEYVTFEEPQYPDAPWASHLGYSINQNWGYIAERLFIDEDDVRNSPEQSFGSDRVMAGDIKYMDLNGDGKITELDKAPIGYPTVPKIMYGFGLSMGYKALDFSFFFQGLAQESFWISTADDWEHGIVNTMPFIGDGNALLKAYADSHWSEDNRNDYALLPRLAPSVIQNNTQPSTWWMRDGSFLRLKSLEVGYTLPKNIQKKLLMNDLRIYFSGTNLLSFSKFKMWDPEMGGNGLAYPVQRVLNLGVQIQF
jgi:TonB-linked SusC/RagA family outer membrane protein